MSQALIIALMITAIFFCLQQGNVFGWIRIAGANAFDDLFGKKASKYIQKPLWDCLPCMSALWTIGLTQTIDPVLILVVCGLLVIIDKFLAYEEVVGG